MRIALLTVSIIIILVTIPGIAAEQTWTGQISDSAHSTHRDHFVQGIVIARST